MTEIVIASDFHNEFPRKSIIDSDPTTSITGMDGDEDRVLVMAGDLGQVNIPESWQPQLEDWCNRFKHVIYIAGNHEFYGGCDMIEGNQEIIDYCSKFENLTYSGLTGNVVHIDDIRFVCHPLFSSMGTNPNVRAFIENVINDFNQVSFRGKPLRAEDYADMYFQALDFLNDMINPDHERTVVVTHWTPSFRSVAPRFKGSPLNQYFSNDLDYRINLIWNPKLWIHGHTHDYYDYMLGDTRIVCNPRGYAHEHSNGYTPRKTVEI